MTNSLIFNRPRILQQKTAHTSQDLFVYELIWDDIFERLSLILRKFDRILVIAPPEAAMLEKLSALYGADAISWAWHTQSDLPNYSQKIDECIELKPNTYDLIISIGEFAWLNDIQRALFHIRQSLKPDGLLMAQFAGGNTLTELRQCLMQAQSELSDKIGAHIHPMMEVRTFGSLLQQAGFALPVVDAEPHIIAYSNIMRLFEDIKLHGASNSLTGAKLPLNRAVMAKMLEIYAAQFANENGKAIATLEIICATAWAPHESQQKPLKPGNARVSLHDVLGKTENPSSRA